MTSSTICCLIVGLAVLTLAVTLFGCVKRENFQGEQEVVVGDEKILKAFRLPRDPEDEGDQEYPIEHFSSCGSKKKEGSSDNHPQGVDVSAFASPLS